MIVDPSKCKVYGLAKAQDYTFFGLVIQYHIESIGKPILLKGDEVLIMSHLHKCLEILLQKTLDHTLTILPVQNPNVILGPTNSHLSRPTEIRLMEQLPKP